MEGDPKGCPICFLYIPTLPSTDKVGTMAFGMASNLFHLRHNFLTRKCPSLSTKRHFLKHTEIYVSSEMIAYAPQDILPTMPVPVRLCIYKKDSGARSEKSFCSWIMTAHASICNNCLAGYISGILRSKKSNYSGNVFRFSDKW